MYNPFTKHPHSIGETYISHLCHSLTYSMKFLWLHIMTLIHAIFPFVFENASSKLVKKINDHLENRLSKNSK